MSSAVSHHKGSSSLFILDSLTAIGGSERKAIRIINQLAARGRPVHCGYLNHPDTLLKELRSDVSRLYLGRKGKFDYGALKILRGYIETRKVDVLFCMNLYPALYGILSGKCGNAHQSKKTYVLINKNNFVPRREEAKMLIYRPLLGKADKIVFGCRNQQGRWIRRYWINSSTCSHIYNGVDCSWFSPDSFAEEGERFRDRLGIGRDEVVIANVAAHLPKKKQEDLISACAALIKTGHQVRLLLAGDGPRRPHLKHTAHQLGIDAKVHFLGQVMDVRSLLSACDIFALSSVAENFSNAALEAMAMEKPIVLSRVGGADEMVREGENGFLYPPSDIPALTSRLKALIENPQTREQMGRHARRIVEERFSFQRMIDEYERMIDT